MFLNTYKIKMKVTYEYDEHYTELIQIMLMPGLHIHSTCMFFLASTLSESTNVFLQNCSVENLTDLRMYIKKKLIINNSFLLGETTS